MKVLLIGREGQLARLLRATVPAGVTLQVLGHEELDIAAPDAVHAALERAQPAVILNAAAYTQVDAAEADAERAFAVNAAGPRHLASGARALGARLMHVSTDYVFAGDRAQPWRPDDAPAPLGVYGRSKLAGEQAVLETLPRRALVLRTAWVYSAHGHNFVKTMLRIMREKGRVRVVADQFGTPTSARSIAEVLWALAARPDRAGVYHWTDAGTATWYDFAVAIAEEAYAAGLLAAPPGVEPITTADYPTPARRPRFSVLDTSTTVRDAGCVPLHWRARLRHVLEELKNG